MAWRVAKSLEMLRAQVNTLAPNRSKASDGTIGDAVHASRSSDHNPHVKDGSMGVVTALDITHDPKNGVDSEALAEMLRASKDPRIKYVLSNKKIFSGTGQGKTAWAWRKYTGSNPHNKHVHLSVKGTKKLYDDVRPWAITLVSANPLAQFIPQQNPDPEDKGVPPGGDPDVFLVQTRLKTMGYSPGEIDGLWGGKTAGAIAAFLNDIPVTPPFSAPVSAADFKKVLPQLNTLLANATKKGFSRPISEERATATPAELAPKLPEVAKAQAAERTGFWAAVTGGVSAAGTAIVKGLGDVVEWLQPVKEFAGDVPWYAWTALAFVVSGVVYFASRQAGQAKDAATDAYQSGERL